MVITRDHWAGPDELMGQVGPYGSDHPSVKEKQRDHWGGPDKLI